MTASANPIRSSREHQAASLEVRVRDLERERDELSALVDRQRAEIEALAHGREFFRTIVESEPSCVKLLARDGTVLSMNSAGLAMCEFDKEEDAIGYEVLSYACPEYHATLKESLEHNFEGGSAHFEFEIVGLKGTRRRVETFSAPLRDVKGEVIASLAISHDVTARELDRVELEQHREHLEELVAERTRELEASRLATQRAEGLVSLGTLAAGIAHELNNPLGTIQLAAETALQSATDDAARGVLESIRADVQRCGRIVRSVLQFSREEPSEKWPLSLDRVLSRARDLVRRTAEERGVPIEIEVDSSMKPVQGNETELERVFLNLFENAVLAAKRDSLVRARARVGGEYAVVEVIDHGAGMTPEEENRAFDPFYTTRQKEGGCGLGLSVSHGIVRDHGGTISVDSIPGRGTTLTIQLPLAATPPFSGVPAPPAP